MGDPGMEVLRRSEHYPGMLWAGRIMALAMVVLLTALFFINARAGIFVVLLALPFFIVSCVAVVLAIQRFCRDHPGSVRWLVRKSAVAAINMDLFRRKPPM